MPPYAEPPLPPLTPAQREQTARYVERLSQIATEEGWMPNDLIRTGLDLVAHIDPKPRRDLRMLCEDMREWEREWAFREIGEAVSLVLEKIIEERIMQTGG